MLPGSKADENNFRDLEFHARAVDPSTKPGKRNEARRKRQGTEPAWCGLGRRHPVRL